MTQKTFALKGTIIWSESPTQLTIHENSCLVCENGVCAGVFPTLPEKFAGISCRDTGDSIIIPGLTDLHLHAPQYSFRSLGMDLELLEWLDTLAFPEESKYADLEYAELPFLPLSTFLQQSIL